MALPGPVTGISQVLFMEVPLAFFWFILYVPPNTLTKSQDSQPNGLTSTSRMLDIEPNSQHSEPLLSACVQAFVRSVFRPAHTSPGCLCLWPLMSCIGTMAAVSCSSSFMIVTARFTLPHTIKAISASRPQFTKASLCSSQRPHSAVHKGLTLHDTTI